MVDADDTDLVSARNRRCSDVGTTPIVPTLWLCRPGGWIAGWVGDRGGEVGIITS